VNPLSLKPAPEVENAAKTLQKVGMLSEEGKSKYLLLLLAATDRAFKFLVTSFLDIKSMPAGMHEA
jgi:hypothetical protein